MSRTITVTSSAMPTLLGFPALEVSSLGGGESLSQLYKYRLNLITPDNPLITQYVSANVDYKKLVGKEMTVSLEIEGGIREISGLVTHASFVRAEDRRSVYEVVMEPWLTLATRTSDYKIYQQKSVLDIVKEVLSDYSFPTDVRLSESYPVQNYIVQYGETDYDFISRLMAEWGIYFFFEHKDKKHQLVLVDGPGAHKKYEASPAYHEVNFYPPGRKLDEEYVSDFQMSENLQSGVWVAGDFDFTAPKADLQKKIKMPRKTGFADMEMYQWPGGYTKAGFDNEEAGLLTKVRMEGAGTEGSQAHGSGTLRGMVTGCTFTLKNHPNNKANKEYLITSSHLFVQDNGQASGQGEYVCSSSFFVIPSNKIFRPRVALDDYGRPSKPRTTGPQTATVVGPAGEEIHTDQYGRVKLSFHWNRYCPKNENSSCWVRVASPWAGNSFGGISLPRVGQEVIVDFENGDPDRPIVIGRVYNALNMPPWDLPANKTKSGVFTRSTTG